MVEKLRMMGYIGFWIVVLTGIFLTKAYSGVNFGLKMYRFLSGLKLFEAFTIQIGLVSLAMSNTLHGIKSGYY